MRASLHITVVALAAFASPLPIRAQSPPADWPMFRGNPQLTGVATSALPETLALCWRVETPEPIESTAAVVDGTVYVGGGDGVIYAFDLRTGKEKWKHKAGEVIRCSPTVYRERLYVGDEDGVMHAVSAKDGAPLWTYKTEGEIVSSPVPSGDRIVFGAYDGRLYAVSADEGKLLWTVQAEDRIHGTPSVLEDSVLITGCDGYLRRVRIIDGSEVSKTHLNAYCGASAALRDNHVYVGTFENNVLGVDVVAGKIDWQYQHAEREFPYLSSAAVTDALIVVGGRDKLMHALDRRSGKEMWTFRTGGRIDGSPVVVGDRVVFGSADGVLYALDAATGKERWRYETAAAFYASPAVAGGRLIISGDDGVIYCFGECPPGAK